MPSKIRSSIVANGSGLLVSPSGLGSGRRKTLSLGMLAPSAASRAVSSNGMHVKRARAPAERSWCFSSTADETALAGVTMPENLWIEYAAVM